MSNEIISNNELVYNVEVKYFNEIPIRFIPAIGYWCATDACMACGKQINDYLRLNKTNNFLDVLFEQTGNPVMEINQGFEALVCKFIYPSEFAGTWVHKDVFTHNIC